MQVPRIAVQLAASADPRHTASLGPCGRSATLSGMKDGTSIGMVAVFAVILLVVAAGLGYLVVLSTQGTGGGLAGDNAPILMVDATPMPNGSP